MNRYRKKTLEIANYGKGAFAGFVEHRHGPRSKISLAHQQKPKAIITDTRRSQLVSLMIDHLADWRYSAFEGEAGCRAGLRAAFCLQGNGWEESDKEAAEIVSTALSRLGAKRPEIIEGQAHFTAGTEYCNWCAIPMGEARRTHGQRYCSTECAQKSIRFRGYGDKGKRDVSAHAAYNLIRNERMPPRSCKFCSSEFRAYHPTQECCSPSCAKKLQAGDRVLLDRACKWCGDNFKPRKQSQLFCSHICHGISSAQEERQRMASVRRSCECCGTPYVPSAEKTKYCSKACQSTAASRLYYQRNRKLYSHTCEWCGDAFDSKIPWARYCSKQHGSAAYKAAKKVVATDNVIYLTAENFDRTFCVCNPALKSTMGDNIFDRLFA